MPLNGFKITALRGTCLGGISPNGQGFSCRFLNEWMKKIKVNSFVFQMVLTQSLEVVREIIH